MIRTSIVQKKYYQINNIDETEYSKKVWQRKEILEKYELLKSESCVDEIIFDVLGISRAALFRWKRRYKLYGLAGLEDESKRPNNLRQKSWTKEIENRIYHLRIQYPVWGKAKIAVIYNQKFKEKLSVSTVGRIIKKLVDSDRIKSVNFVCNKKLSKNRIFNGHAKRWKKGMKANQPGELIQIDHMTIQVPGIGYVKQFNAICPITKIIVEKIYNEANSRNGADFLRHIKEKFPFPILSIQVDGGGEFMADFEKLCQNLNIPLFVLPPRSPECNSHVERSNGTFKYEFYSNYNGGPSFHILQKDLHKFTIFYNTRRPHQRLGYLTPYEFYESLKKEAFQSRMY